MSGLIDAMKSLRAIFDKYAGNDKNKDTLSKTELADLLKNEGFGDISANKAEAENFFKALDNDGDGVVNFEEYVTFVAALTVILKLK